MIRILCCLTLIAHLWSGEAEGEWARFTADPRGEAGRIAGYEHLAAAIAFDGDTLSATLSSGAPPLALQVRQRIADFAAATAGDQEWGPVARLLEKRLKFALGGIPTPVAATAILSGVSPVLPLPQRATGVTWRVFRDTPADATGVLDAVWSRPLVPHGDGGAVLDSGRGQLDELRLPGPGLYRIEAEDDSVLAMRQALVGDLAAAIAVEPRHGQVLALLTDRDGRPLAGAEVAVRLQLTLDAPAAPAWRRHGESDAASDLPAHIETWESSEPLAELAVTARTDAGGLATLPFPHPGAGLGVRWRLAAHGRPGDAHAPLLIAAGQVGADQPSERTLAHLSADRPLYRGGDTVRLRLVVRRFRDGRELPHHGWRGRLTLSHGQDRLAEVPVTTGEFGTAAAEVVLPAECATGVYQWTLRPPEERSEPLVSGAAFRVEDFRLDDLVVEAVADRPAYGAGATAVVTIDARLRDGTPLVSANGFATSRLTGLVTPFTTDGAGRAVLTIPPAAQVVGGMLAVTVEDARRRPVETWVDLPWGAGDGTIRPRLTVACRHGVVRVGEGIAVTVASEHPQPLPVTLILLRRTPERGTAPVATAQVMLAKGAATHHFTAITPGIYEVHLGNGPYQWSGGATCEVVDDRAAKPGRDLGFTIAPGPHRIGDVVEARLAGPAGAVALVVIEGREGAEARSVRLVDGLALVPVTLAAHHAPAVRLTATLSGRETRSARAEIAIAQLTGLTVTVLPRDGDLAPGATTRCRVEVRDHEGRPVLGEIALGVVDEAIYDLEREPWGALQFPAPHPQARTATWHDPAPAAANLLAELFADDPEGRFRLQGWHTTSGGAFMAIGAGGGSAGMFGSRSSGGARRGMTVAGGAKGLERPPTRRDFSVTAFWSPAVRTDAAGDAEVELRMPDSLTAWRITARVVAHDRRAGYARATIRTRQAVSLRPDLPRLLRRGDTCDLQAVVVNDRDLPLRGTLTVIAKTLGLAKPSVPVEVAPRSQATVRLTCTVPATTPDGPAPIRLELESNVAADDAGDAVELTLPVTDAGEPQRFVASGTVNGKVAIAVPALSGAGHHATLVLSSGPAGTLIAAADYLAGYPYGCVEQTLSRFMPALALVSGLERAGIDAATVRAGLDERVTAGLGRLAAMRRADGSWGWWHGVDGDLEMTAFVRLGLVEAAAGGADLAKHGLDRPFTFDWKRWLAEPAVMAALRGAPLPAEEDALLAAEEAVAGFRRALGVARADRESLLLLAYAEARAGRVKADELRPLLSAPDWPTIGERALAALTLDAGGDRAGAIQTLHQPLTHLVTVPTGWLADPTVSTSWHLRAVTALEPARADETWRTLAANRQGARWPSTRHTAYALLAAADHLRVRPAQGAASAWLVTLAGKELARGVFAPGKPVPPIVLPPAVLARGATVEVITEGGACDYDLACAWRGQPAGPAAVASPLTIERHYRVIRRGRFGEEVAADPGTALRAGERVRVELVLTCAQPLAHVLVADPRCPGLQPALIRSDVRHAPADSVSVRDGELAFFITSLKPGRTVISYDAYAERSGRFRVPGARGEAMYEPAISATTPGAEMAIAAAALAPAADSRVTVDAGAYRQLVDGLTAALTTPGGGTRDADLLRRLLELPDQAGDAYLALGLPGLDPAALADRDLADRVVRRWARLLANLERVAPDHAALGRLFALPASAAAIASAGETLLLASDERRATTANALLALPLPREARVGMLTALAGALKPAAALAFALDLAERRDRVVMLRALVDGPQRSPATLFDQITWRGDRPTWTRAVVAEPCALVIRLAAGLPHASGLERQLLWRALGQTQRGLIQTAQHTDLAPEAAAALAEAREAAGRALLGARVTARTDQERELGDQALRQLVELRSLPTDVLPAVLGIPDAADRARLTALVLPGVKLPWTAWRDALAGEMHAAVRQALVQGMPRPAVDDPSITAWREWLASTIRSEQDSGTRQALVTLLAGSLPGAAVALIDEPRLAPAVVVALGRASGLGELRTRLRPVCKQLLATSDDPQVLLAAWRIAPDHGLDADRLLLIAGIGDDDIAGLLPVLAERRIDAQELWRRLAATSDHRVRWRFAQLIADGGGDPAWLRPLLDKPHELTRYAFAILAVHGDPDALARLDDAEFAVQHALEGALLGRAARSHGDGALLRRWLGRADRRIPSSIVFQAASRVGDDELAALAAGDERFLAALLPNLVQRRVARPELLAPLARHVTTLTGQPGGISLLLAGTAPAALMPALNGAWTATDLRGRLLLCKLLANRHEAAWATWFTPHLPNAGPWLRPVIARHLAACGGEPPADVVLSDAGRRDLLRTRDDTRVRAMVSDVDPRWRQAAAGVWYERHRERLPVAGPAGEARRHAPWAER